MTSVFLDTGAIYTLVDQRDPDHATVADAYRKTERFLTHSAVLMETVSLISKRLRKTLALDVVAALRSSPKIEVVHVDPLLAQQSWNRCLRFADKEWDWIDCTSFELMTSRGMRKALTLDHHFVQAGFRSLVK